MQPNSITLRVSPEAAKAYRSAPESEKKLAEELIEILFRAKRRVGPSEFRKLAEDANREAASKGLTEEKLQQILDEG
jgi:hypothetical protein